MDEHKRRIIRNLAVVGALGLAAAGAITVMQRNPQLAPVTEQHGVMGYTGPTLPEPGAHPTLGPQPTVTPIPQAGWCHQPDGSCFAMPNPIGLPCSGAVTQVPCPDVPPTPTPTPPGPTATPTAGPSATPTPTSTAAWATGAMTSYPEGIIPAISPISYVQGPSPILMPDSSLCVMVNAGPRWEPGMPAMGPGQWEGIFGLIYPADGSSPYWQPMGGSNAWGTQQERDQHERGFASAVLIPEGTHSMIVPPMVFHNAVWYVAYARTRASTMGKWQRVRVGLTMVRALVGDWEQEVAPYGRSEEWLCGLGAGCEEYDHPTGGVYPVAAWRAWGSWWFLARDLTLTTQAQLSGYVLRELDDQWRIKAWSHVWATRMPGVGDGTTAERPEWTDAGVGADGRIYLLESPQPYLDAGSAPIREWVFDGAVAQLTGRTWSSPVGQQVADGGYVRDAGGRIIRPNTVFAVESPSTDWGASVWHLRWWAQSTVHLPRTISYATVGPVTPPGVSARREAARAEGGAMRSLKP